jgi:hypothetical protein
MLPAAGFQALTDPDRKRLEQFRQKDHPFVADQLPGRQDDLEQMWPKGGTGSAPLVEDAVLWRICRWTVGACTAPRPHR